MPVEIPTRKRGLTYRPEALKKRFGDFWYKGAERDWNKGLIRNESDLESIKKFRKESPKQNINYDQFQRWKETGHTSITLAAGAKIGEVGGKIYEKAKEKLAPIFKSAIGEEAKPFRYSEELLPSRFIEPSPLEVQLSELMGQLAPQFAQQAVSQQIPQIPFASQLAAGPMMQQPTQMNFGDLMAQLGGQAAPFLQQYLQSQGGQELLGTGQQYGQQALQGLGTAGSALMGGVQRGASGLSGLLSQLFRR